MEYGMKNLQYSPDSLLVKNKRILGGIFNWMTMWLSLYDLNMWQYLSTSMIQAINLVFDVMMG